MPAGTGGHCTGLEVTVVKMATSRSFCEERPRGCPEGRPLTTGREQTQARNESRAPRGGAKRILFFPLSNVLGHLTRTLALAEEFDAQGHEVCIAVDRTYSSLAKVLPATIRVLSAREMYAQATRSFGPIQQYREGIAKDRVNLESSSRMSKSELRRRGRRLTEMIERDTAIVEEVRPDAIITDYHFTAKLFQLPPRTLVFHISHALGYPSFFRRVMGSYFFPLDSGHILVPGIRSIEYWRRGAAHVSPQGRESLCGMFHWRGWQRLHGDTPAPPRSQVFLFFGSTGNGQQIVPWFLQNIPARYRVSSIAPGLADGGGRGGVYISKNGDLGRFLDRTEVAFCHGGHGTVMECILHQTPMVVFPHNIEQLEIGRRIEKMRLGILVKRPYHELSGEELGEIIEKIRTDARMRVNLRKYSMLLRRENGPKQAASIVLRSLADRGDGALGDGTNQEVRGCA